jgi:hypothetical protein
MARAVRVALLLLVVASLRADDLPALEAGLKQAYEGKTLTLRRANCNDRIRFDSQGGLLGRLKDGPWTLCSKLVVRRLQLKPKELTLEGRRVWVAFTPGIQHVEGEAKVQVRFQMIRTAADQVSVNGMLAAAFLKTGEPLTDVPDAWKPYLSGALPQTGREAGLLRPTYAAAGRFT